MGKVPALYLPLMLYEGIKSLSNEVRGELFLALYQYGVEGTVMEGLSPVASAMFFMYKGVIDEDARRYEEKCEKRRAAGAMGGHAKASRGTADAHYNEEANVANASFAKQNEQNPANLANTTQLKSTQHNTTQYNTTQHNSKLSLLSGDNKERVCDNGEAAAEKPARRKTRVVKMYGKFKNVFLTDEEYALLGEALRNREEQIDALSTFMESTGKTYANHYATLLRWEKKDREKAVRRGKDHDRSYDIEAFDKGGFDLPDPPSFDLEEFKKQGFDLPETDGESDDK